MPKEHSFPPSGEMKIKEANIMSEPDSLVLEQVGTTTIPALPSFDVAAHFRVTTEERREDVEVPIGYMNDVAKRLVSALATSEPEVPETTLRIHKLRKDSVDAPVIAELGELATTTWAQMYEMMRRQSHGEQGNLLTNGYANVFYIPDIDGTFWAVDCRWPSDRQYWCVRVYQVSFPDAWSAASQVVSR